MGNIRLANGLCVKCNDNKLKPCIGKRDKALCVTHWRYYHRRSAKGKIEDMIYQDLKAEFMAKEENQYCQIRIDGICTHIADQIHHDTGHGGRYLDVSTYIACCLPCHRYVEDHPNFAYENDFSKSRLANVSFLARSINSENTINNNK
jgi:hypothetical protein